MSIWLKRCHTVWLETVRRREPYTVLCRSHGGVLSVLVDAATHTSGTHDKQSLYHNCAICVMYVLDTYSNQSLTHGNKSMGWRVMSLRSIASSCLSDNFDNNSSDTLGCHTYALCVCVLADNALITTVMQCIRSMICRYLSDT